MIVIINYGVGNLTSVKNILKKAGGQEIVISDKSSDIEAAHKIILPGVGHFDFGMKMLHNSGLIPFIERRIFEDKIPILGICLGAQLMTHGSDEGVTPGLGWIKGKTLSFDKNRLDKGAKVPHMGWNYVLTQKFSPLFQNMHVNPRFYFVHSFHLSMDNEEDVWLTAKYGYDFCAAYQKENIFACQFHPEKSHKFGLKLMENFVAL